MTYLLQVSTCWIVFYGIYLLFLRKETFFSINRYYLLGALVTGLLVPYLGAFIPANDASVEVYQVMTQFSTVEVSQQAYVEEATPVFTWMNLLWAAYIIGALVVFSRFIYGLNRIYTIYKEADKTPQTNYTLVESDKYHLPFSFFHFIFISKQLPLNEEVEKVLRHEELHANQWHSVDIVFTELLQVFFWFNPILIFYKNALRQSHEYLADAYVTQDHNKNSYGQLLLQQSTSGLEVALANQFFHSQIKKRITMMYKEKSKRSAMVKYLAAVPVLVGMLIIFSSNQMAEGYSKEELLNYFDKDFKNLISVNENGDYFLDDKTLSIDLIPDVLENIKSLQKNLILEVNPASKNEFVVKILDLAYENDVLVTLRTSDINGEETLKPYKKQLEKLHENKYGLKAKMEGARDQIISVLENGVYLFKNIPLSDEKITSLLILIKEADGKLFINAQEGVQWNYVSKLLESAAQLGVQSVINDQNIPENFNGRKIIERNWEAFANHLNKADGKVVINAEANAAGKMVYVEIDSELSTITDRDILKNILSAAKGFRIEAGEGKANGTLIFNLSKNGTSKNLHDEYINQYNYGERNKDRTMLDLIEDFSNDSGDPIFKVVEEMPRFPGCEDMEGIAKEKEQCAKQKMLEFVYANLKYPAKARDANVEGMCVVQFVIEKNGSVTGAKVVRDIGADCGMETMKVINSFPNWIPGKQKGKAVRVQYTLPVKFKLEGTSEKENTKKDETVNVVGFGESNPKAKKENLSINTKAELKGDILKVSQEMPRFSGCEDMEGTVKEKEECAKHKMLEYVYNNIKYPKEAREKGIDGMSVIRMVIEKDGSVSNVSTLRDPGAGTGAEAARIVREMPTWIPGKQKGKPVRVQYTLPVKFKLEKENKSSNLEGLLKGKTSGVSINGDSDRKIRLKTSNSNQPEPLYVVDEKIQESSTIESINPNDIESVNVFKGEKAIEKYGEAGENGVVEITLKASKKEAKDVPKTSLTYTADQFKEIRDIYYILKDAGLKEESKAKVIRYTLVRVPYKQDAHIAQSDNGQFDSRILELTSQAKITDRYFIEEIIISKDGKEENIGALSIMIVDGMPSLVRPLTIVNGKKVTSDWMNNINPDDIATIDILEGEEMIEKHGDIPHNSVVNITLKPGKKLTKYLIDGKLFGYNFYRKIDKSHINIERTGTKEERFMRGMTEDLIVVTMADGYGLTSAYFPGTNTEDSSDKALLDFVGKNINYPKAAKDNEIEGVVTVRYTVKENGELTDFEIEKSLGWGLDEEVLDMMDKLAEEKGDWSAAQLDRNAIATSMKLPVKFKLQSDQKKEAKSNNLNTINFSISPNPSDGNINIVYQLDKNIPVNLTFYSMEGKVIKRMLNLPAENNISVDLSTHNLPLVYITLEQDGKTQTRKATFQ